MSHIASSYLPGIPRVAVRKALLPYVGAVAWKGFLVIAIDLATYLGGLAGILFLPNIFLKLLCAFMAGFGISNLIILGHDAAHGSLVPSKRMNKALAVVCFMPSLINYRLWLFEHHHVHHAYTNGTLHNSWTPLSIAEYQAMPAWRRALEQFYRAPFGLGFSTYYIIERWFPIHFFPSAIVPRRFHTSAWRHFALLVTWLVTVVAFLAAAPIYSSTGSLTAIALGFIIPFYVGLGLFSLGVYVQHTNVRIPWFDGPVDRKDAFPPETLSAHIQVPAWFNLITHNVMNHPVHHVDMRISCYRLGEAQRVLNQLAGEAAVIDQFSARWLNDTLRRCKLYDYERHLWLYFDGTPSAPRTVLNLARLEANLARGTMYREHVM